MSSTGTVTPGGEIRYVTKIKVTLQSTNLSKISIAASHSAGSWIVTGATVDPAQTSGSCGTSSSVAQCTLDGISGKGEYTYTLTTRFKPQVAGDALYTVVLRYLEGQGAGSPTPKQESTSTSTSVGSGTDSTWTWLPPEGGTVATNQTISDTNQQSTLVTVPNLGSASPASGYVVSLEERMPRKDDGSLDTSAYCGPSEENDGSTTGTATCTSEVSFVTVTCAVDSECEAKRNADDAKSFVFPDENPLHVTIKSMELDLPPTTIWHSGRAVPLGVTIATCLDADYLYDSHDRGDLEEGDIVDVCSYLVSQKLGQDDKPFVQFDIKGRKNGDYRS